MPEANVFDPGSQRGDPSIRLTADQVTALQGMVSGAGVAMARSRIALAKVRAGVANAKIVRIGDSTECGRGSPTSGSFVGSYATAPHKVFTDRLASILGVTVRQNSFTCQTSQGAIAAYDSRMSVGAGWGGTGNYGVGGSVWYNDTTTNVLAFTPSNNCDTFDVYYSDILSGVFSVQVDALGAVNTTLGGTSTLKKVSQSQTLGAHTLNIARVSGAIRLLGAHCYDSTTKEVSVFNGGWSGAKVADWASITPTGRSPIDHLKLLAPDLTIIRPGTNDWIAGTDVSAFQNDLGYLVSQAQISGDVIIAPNFPANTATVSSDTQSLYVAACLAVAQQYGCGYISHWGRSGGYAVANAAGYYDSDNVHFSKSGYSAIGTSDAELVARLLAA